MNIDVSNVPDINYLENEGEQTLKVASVGEGTTANKNPVLKVSFADKDGAIFNDDFVLTEKAMFRIKGLIKALRLPDKIEANDMVGRYVVADLYKKIEKTQNGSFEKMTARAYKESPLQVKIDSEADGAFELMNEKQQTALKLYLSSATLDNDFTPDSDAVIALKMQEAGVQSSKTSVERWRKQFDFKRHLELHVSAVLSGDEKIKSMVAKAGNDALIDKTVVDLKRNNELTSKSYGILEKYADGVLKRYEETGVIAQKDAELAIKIASLTAGREDRMLDRKAMLGAAELISKKDALAGLECVDVEIEGEEGLELE